MTNKKKIFDIIPPKEAKKPETPIEKPSFKKPFPSLKKPPSFVKKTPTLIVIGIILVGIVGSAFIKPKAEIEIWPEKDEVSFKTQVVVASLIAEIQFEEGIIPGEILSVEKSASQEFSSSGRQLKSAKAHGIIRVYNAYSVSSQTLVATTRFVSDDGKLFRTPKRLVIPGAHYEGGKLIPGSIDIEVIADQPGEEYNIGPSTFSIPGFAGTARYTAFYAKSFESMTGGMKEEASLVTKEDLDKAQEILTRQALEESKTSLESLIPLEEYILVEGAITEEITEITPLVEEGQEVDSFLFQVKAETKALVFRKSDLKSFAKVYSLAQVPQGKHLQETSLAINYLLPKSLDLEGGEITLDLEISAQIYSVVAEDLLKEAIKNKRPNEVVIALRKFPEIKRAQIRLWPFWITKAPEAQDRIDIRLRVD